MMCSRGMKHFVFSLYSAWVGDYCEEDLDGCSEFSCFPGVQCFDVPAPGSGAVCGPCPMGYVKDEEKCAGESITVEIENSRSCVHTYTGASCNAYVVIMILCS